MSFQAMAWAVNQKVGSATGKALLLMLANYADDEGKCWPTQERLADECECSIATVARWLVAFENIGLLIREKRYGEGGYMRSDLLRLSLGLPVTKLGSTELPSTELPNSKSKLTLHKAGAEPIREPISSFSEGCEREQTRQVVKSLSSQFEVFWSAYPNKVGKRDAERAFVKALQRSEFQAIMAGLQRYVQKTDDRPWCNPTTFLNQDRWEDQPAAPVPRQAASRQQPPTQAPRNAGEYLRQKRLNQEAQSNASIEPNRHLDQGHGRAEGAISGFARRIAIPHQQ